MRRRLTPPYATVNAVRAMADAILASEDGKIRDYPPMDTPLIKSCIDSGLLKAIDRRRRVFTITNNGVVRLEEASTNASMWPICAIALLRVRG